MPPDSPFGAPSRHDLYLSPHSDDICFSLGFLALTRARGSMLTVFPISNYTAQATAGKVADTRAVTLRRLSEDAAFANACGLRLGTLDHRDAVVRGQKPFAAGPAQDVANLIEADLMAVIDGAALGRHSRMRPWLFCPAAIGGHVDHLAVLLVVLRHLPSIQASWRVGIYEDLHYASSRDKREAGLQMLDSLLPPGGLKREAIALDTQAAVAAKMRLVHLYGSQLTPRQRSIAAFTPASTASDSAADLATAAPHEAVWVVQDLAQKPG